MSHNLGRNPADLLINLWGPCNGVAVPSLKIASIGHPLEGSSHRGRNIEKADPAVKEGRRGGLIGRTKALGAGKGRMARGRRGGRHARVVR